MADDTATLQRINTDPELPDKCDRAAAQLDGKQGIGGTVVREWDDETIELIDTHRQLLAFLRGNDATTIGELVDGEVIGHDPSVSDFNDLHAAGLIDYRTIPDDEPMDAIPVNPHDTLLVAAF